MQVTGIFIFKGFFRVLNLLMFNSWIPFLQTLHAFPFVLVSKECCLHITLFSLIQSVRIGWVL